MDIERTSKEGRAVELENIDTTNTTRDIDIPLAGNKKKLLKRTSVFIRNGAITIFLAFPGRLLILDFPDKIHKARFPFLNHAQVHAIQDTLNRRNPEFDEIDFKNFARALGRWELWVYALKFFAVTTIMYAPAFFIPIILQGIGYNASKVFLLSAPPAVAAVPWVMFCSWAAHR
ncbi:hypothetical protein BDU57DRAFT_534670 [Ampelomyces quisqualis]|uniref:Major facilitator superfamily domain-containing protein n=1 Tax=Ampelomyces quisqualis TaxID=50730 RepID=A0A6A5R0G4_AMPQU|nr:hypothetical protein BDU57DRAFT_534670 [Ampelomyces quisqualis]